MGFFFRQPDNRARPGRCDDLRAHDIINCEIDSNSKRCTAAEGSVRNRNKYIIILYNDVASNSETGVSDTNEYLETIF